MSVPQRMVIGGRETEPLSCTSCPQTHRKFYADLSDGTRVLVATRCGDHHPEDPINWGRIIIRGEEVDSNPCQGCSETHLSLKVRLNDGADKDWFLDALCEPNAA